MSDCFTQFIIILSFRFSCNIGGPQFLLASKASRQRWTWNCCSRMPRCTPLKFPMTRDICFGSSSQFVSYLREISTLGTFYCFPAAKFFPRATFRKKFLWLVCNTSNVRPLNKGFWTLIKRRLYPPYIFLNAHLLALQLHRKCGINYITFFSMFTLFLALGTSFFLRAANQSVVDFAAVQECRIVFSFRIICVYREQTSCRSPEEPQLDSRWSSRLSLAPVRPAAWLRHVVCAFTAIHRIPGQWNQRGVKPVTVTKEIRPVLFYPSFEFLWCSNSDLKQTKT